MADKKNQSSTNSNPSGSQQNGSDVEDAFLQKYAAEPGNDVILSITDTTPGYPEGHSETGCVSVSGEKTQPSTTGMGGKDVPATVKNGQNNGVSSTPPNVNGRDSKSDQVSKHGQKTGTPATPNGNNVSAASTPHSRGHYTKSGHPSASNLLKSKSASRENLSGSRESLNSIKSGVSVKSGSTRVTGASSSKSNDDTTCANPNYVKHASTANGNHSMKNGASDSSSVTPELPTRQPTSGGGTGTARQKVNKTGSNLASSIPEEEITIPNDGNLVAFTADAMATFLRYLRVEDRLVNHLHRNGLDGRKFGRMKDSDLDNLHLKNPVVIYFRDKTAPAANKKPKQRLPFVL